MKKYHVYVGYYEVYLTTHKLPGPVSLASWHKTAEAAEKRALKDWPSATFLYDEDTLEDLGYDWVIRDYDYILDDNNIKFWQC